MSDSFLVGSVCAYHLQGTQSTSANQTVETTTVRMESCIFMSKNFIEFSYENSALFCDISREFVQQ